MRWLAAILCLALTGCGAAIRGGRMIAREGQRAADRAEVEASLPPVSAMPSLDSPPAHPRLVARNQDIERVKRLIETDDLAKRWFARLHEHAERYARESPLQQPRGAMLQTGRQALVRLTTLGAIYRLSGDDRIGRRAIEEMKNLATFREWGGQDEFLATAEMTTAVAFAFDWTYGLMSPAERATIARAISDRGLREGLKAYESDLGWTEAQHNWNLVCNGGMIVGALAVLDEDPKLARDVLAHARKSIRYGMSCFAPDGAWEEGPTYWNYATRYAAFAFASLQSALNTDWGLAGAPGFANAGMFRIHVAGPTGLPFDFADSEPVIGNSAQMLWLASAFDRDVYAAFEQRHSADDPGVFDLLWYAPVDPTVLSKLPRDAMFRGVDVACMRGSWTDPMTSYVAVKGGSNEAHHGHLDLGTFVVDMLGERWAVELGGDNYDLPDYFGERRWSYYRCSTRGQNVVTLDKENQAETARSKVVAFAPGDARSHVVLDLTEGYSAKARRFQRGVALLDRRKVLIQDELELKGPADVRWTMHTTAEVRAEGATARLSQGGKTVSARIISPRGARFEVAPVSLRPPQEPAPDVKALVIDVPGVRAPVTLAVTISPDDRTEIESELTPLREWVKR